MEDYEKGALQALDDYFIALNARDSVAMRAQFHFPHFRLSAGIAEPQYYETAEEYGIEVFDARPDTNGWHHTDWDYRRMIHGDAHKVHMDVQFTRYRADGSVLGTFKSLWVVTYREGRWGVQSRSSYAG